MPSPEPYRDDDDPPAKGSPRLFGDMGLLSGCRAYAELRIYDAPEVADYERRRFRLKMLVLIGHECGMDQERIADAERELADRLRCVALPAIPSA